MLSSLQRHHLFVVLTMDAHEAALPELAVVPHQQPLYPGSDSDTKVRQIYGEENGPSPFDVFLRETQRVTLSISTPKADQETITNFRSAKNQQHNKDDTDNEDDDGLTVILPSNTKIEFLGRQVRFKHLTLLVNNISFSDTRSRIVLIFKSFGFLRNIHMPRYRPDLPESHRGFALFTFVTTDGLRAAMQGCRAQLGETRHGGVRVWRLADYHDYEKYCEVLDVGAVMSSSCQAVSSQTVKHTTITAAVPHGDIDKRRVCPSIQRTRWHAKIIREEDVSQIHIRPEGYLGRYVSRKRERSQEPRRKREKPIQPVK